MKKFLVIYKGMSKQKLPGELLKAHVNHLKKLKANNNLITCGPFEDQTGAVLLLQGESKNDIKKLVAMDPFIEKKYYNEFTINEFIEANEANNWLA